MAKPNYNILELMTPNGNSPKTLMEAINYFADKENAVAYFAARRWPNGVTCPACSSHECTAIKTRQLWQCRGCRKQFSVKVGTIFEDSPLSLGKWLTAYWLLTNCRNGISSCEVARSIGVTQKTAWFMMHRIRETMKSGSFLKLSGTVETDSTYIGGAEKNRHAHKRGRHLKGGSGKTVVYGAVERGGNVQARVVEGLGKQDVENYVLSSIAIGSELITDEHHGYHNMKHAYDHKAVNHGRGEYVNGKVHTNTIENYWSLVKRMLKGTYIHVEPYHLDRYLDEQGTRYNLRNQRETSRFENAVDGAPGKRLTYKELTGKVLAA